MVEPEGQRLPGTARIRRGDDIRTVLRRGIRSRTLTLDVYILRVPSRPQPRVGWVVPKLGNGSVARNRLKRRLREIGRTRVLGALSARGVGVDVLVRVRTSAYRATYRQLEEELMSVVDGTW
ncbi:MAG: ribonuclease P protein component [Gemmatimonadetes bacterium]|nr:ribonuclease P protein component [Gemmatimonadota bacterium]MYA43187.1 ribonuclease P protein component [Gemmatimonadota bacterium]MYE93110.1 ribonuclease P protein component [Gemmatimonadota bacterium]MYJ09804.1 ribonuclease P protein component [Gemmatimonadota bacterium]